MKKDCYEKPLVEVVELELMGIIAESDVTMGPFENDGNGGQVKGLDFDPVTGVSIGFDITPHIPMD